MAETKTALKVKKKWFTVLAPEQFGKKDISDITAVSADSTVGKTVDVTGQMLTGLPRDMNRKFFLKITEAVGDKLHTKALAYALTDSFVQRTARRYKERFLYVVTVKTKDDVNCTFKFFFMNLKKLHHSERGKLIAKTKEWITAEAKNYDSAGMFDVMAIEKISNDLKKVLADVYSVDKILLTKMHL